MANSRLSLCFLMGAAASALPINLVGASAAERNVEAVQILREEIALRWNAKSTGARPTGGTGPIGMNYGSIEAEYVDAGPSLRIWFVREGEHAVLPTDNDSNGIPDFVENLASISAEVAERFQEADWRSPLTDSERGLPDYGGDARFDIYLLNFGGGSDGVFVKEFCESTLPARCGGYMAIENDFAGFDYPSASDALRTLFSHEYMHAISAAYTDNLPTWFSEGVATWAENEFADVEQDVVRLASRWYRTPSISLDDSTNPGSGWPYAASAFFLDLSSSFGASFFRGVHERLADGSSRSAAGAVEGELVDAGSSLREAWVSFTARSWFTGSRARSMPDVWFASRMPEITATLFELGEEPRAFELSTWSMQAWTSVLADDAVTWTACAGREAADLVIIGSDGSIVPVAEGDRFALRAGDVLIVSGRPRLSMGVCSELRVVDDVQCPLDNDCEPPCDSVDEECVSGCEPSTETCGPPAPPPGETSSSSCSTSTGGTSLGLAILFALTVVYRSRRSRCLDEELMAI